MRKKRSIPVVLWKLFGKRALTLATAIASLVPPHSSCGCKARICLSCCSGVSSENAISFLLQPRDPHDYRILLSHCYVVFNDNAPPVSADEFSPYNNWPQREIVIRTIEMIIREQSIKSNVICSAYDKCNRSSPIADLLTSPAWSLLLKRVGDDIMIYLLRHTSIFLPFPLKKHYQVAGSPVNSLVFKSLMGKKQPQQHQNPSIIHFGDRKKRGRDDEVNSTFDIERHSNVFTQGSIGCGVTDGSSYLNPVNRYPGNKYGQINETGVAAETCVADFKNYEGHQNEELANLRKQSGNFRQWCCKKQKYSDTSESTTLRPCNRDPANRRDQMNVHEESPSKSRICGMRNEGFSNEKLQGLNHIMQGPGKRLRLFRWLRHRKRWKSDLDNKELQMPQQSSCFHVLQAERLKVNGAQINRQPIFYNLGCYSVLPREHILNSLKPNYAGSKSLIGSVFGLSDVNLSVPSVPCSDSNLFCFSGSTCLYRLLVKSFKNLIRRSHCCKHFKLLDKHCKVSLLTQTNQNSTSFQENNLTMGNEISEKSCGFNADNEPQTELIKSYCTKNQVVSFIWAVCRSIVPPVLLGTPSNWRILRRNISKFIHLRRYEKFSLKQCMHEVKISGFFFLSDELSLCYLAPGVLNNLTGKKVEIQKGSCEWKDAVSNFKHKLLEKWIFWFFSCLVVPILQANFYVTESEHGKQDIFYYRKPVWEKLTSGAIASLKDQNYQCLNASTVESIIGNRPFGFSNLRLLPRENGVRMLANLKMPSRMLFQASKSAKYKHFKPVNSILRETHAVLRGIQLKEPGKLGSSVFDYNDIYEKLCLYILGLKNEFGTLPNIFIVVSDVLKAFDSINQDKLLNVVEDLIYEDEYLLQQSSKVVCTKKSLWVHQDIILTDPDIRNGSKKFSSSDRFGSLHTVTVNQGFSKCMKKKDLFFNLKEHVKRNVLKLDKKFYLQGLGISQGSILSSLLCSIYLGHLERNVIFPFLKKVQEPAAVDLTTSNNFEDSSVTQNSAVHRANPSSSYLLLRYIDDFCFISTSKKLAAGFYARLQRGFRDYNCYMKEEKCCLNFYIDGASGLTSNRVYIGDDGVSFVRWSGLLLNCCTLEVQADYTRYLRNHLRSALTVSWHGKPGRQLEAKLCGFLRPKCHPLLYDSNINSGPVIRLNMYQAFLLCAMKYHCYVIEMVNTCKLQPSSHLKIIERSFRYIYKLIKKRMLTTRRDSCFHPNLQLEAAEVEWLGLNAFIKVLNKKQSRHKDLLSLLKSKLSSHKINASVSSQLHYAIDSSHSSVMWKIKY